MRYTAIVEHGKESGFVAYIPALKGCVSQGPTFDVALANLKEAAEAYVESLIEDHLPVPEEVELRQLELEVA
jgi:predicted RNase H-like HicB family nuclease